MNTKNLWRLAFVLMSMFSMGWGTQAQALLITVQNLGNSKYCSRNTSNNNLYANKTGVSSYDVYYQVDAGGGYVAFQSPSNGRYWRVIASSGLIYCDDTTLDDDNKFQMVWNSTGWALLSAWNNKYVTASTSGNYLAATKTGVSNWERFSTVEVFDMYVVFTAFGTYYPNAMKYEPSGDYYCKEYTNMDYYWGNVDCTYSSRGFNVWDPNRLAMIGDWECVVLPGTYEYYDRNKGFTWGVGIPRIKRYTNVYAQTDTPSASCAWRSINGDCSTTSMGTYSEWYRQYTSELVNFGYDVGTRWVIRFGYRDVAEQWLWDLGPSVGTFSPRYGCLQYSNNGQVINFSTIGTGTPYNTCYTH